MCCNAFIPTYFSFYVTAFISVTDSESLKVFCQNGVQWFPTGEYKGRNNVKNQVHLQKETEKKSMNATHILAIKRRARVSNIMQWNKFTVCLLE